MKLVAAVLSLVCCARLAQAQPGAAPVASPATAAEDPLSPTVGGALSMLGTTAAWTLMFASVAQPETRARDTAFALGALGTLVAPNLGHWYAHEAWTPGLTVRVVSLAVGAVGTALVIQNLFENESDANVGAAIVVIAGLGYLGGTVYDLATVGDSVARYNARSHPLAILPVVQPATGSYGLALGGRF